MGAVTRNERGIITGACTNKSIDSQISDRGQREERAVLVLPLPFGVQCARCICVRPTHPGIDHTKNVNWQSYQQFTERSEEYLKRQFSPLCWLKKPNGVIEKFFLVWWDVSIGF